MHGSEHARYFSLVGVRRNIVLDCHIDFSNSFVVFSHRVVSVLKVNSVELFSTFHSVIKLSVSLVKFAEQVVATTFFIKGLCFINHVKLNSNHSQTCFNFLFIFSLTSSSGSTSKTHVS